MRCAENDDDSLQVSEKMKVKGGKYTGQGDGSKRAFGKDEGRWQRVPVKFLCTNALSLGNKQEAEVQCM